MHDKPLGGSGAVKNNYGAGAVCADHTAAATTVGHFMPHTL